MIVPTVTNKSKQPPLSLEDYSTFQYMLARPQVASQICDEITSFVFYAEAHNPQKSEDEHKVLVKGSVTPWAYYICCLYVLPSHILGMSEWISATRTDNKNKNSTKNNDDDDDDDDTNINNGVVLRRFRYSYYKGLLQVDTRHMQVDTRDKENHPPTTSSFRLVEYMEISFWAWVLMDVVSIVFWTVCVQLLQRGGYMLNMSLAFVVGMLFLTQKTVDILTKHYFQ